MKYKVMLLNVGDAGAEGLIFEGTFLRVFSFGFEHPFYSDSIVIACDEFRGDPIDILCLFPRENVLGVIDITEDKNDTQC